MMEDEAKAKWCPFARVAGASDSQGAGTNGNRWPFDTDASGANMLGAQCVGSACMAWQRQYMSETERHKMIRQQRDLGQSYDDAISHVNRIDEAGDGNCGLARP